MPEKHLMGIWLALSLAFGNWKLEIVRLYQSPEACYIMVKFTVVEAWNRKMHLELTFMISNWCVLLTSLMYHFLSSFFFLFLGSHEVPKQLLGLQFDTDFCAPLLNGKKSGDVFTLHLTL